MALKHFDIDSIGAPETKLYRVIHSQLKLSHYWKIIDMDIETSEREYSDEHSGKIIAFTSDDLMSHISGLTCYHISQKHKDAYRCPYCNKLAPPICYVIRKLRHVNDKGFRCELVVNNPKLDCECGRKPRVRFPAADDGKRYTKALEIAVLGSLMTKSRIKTANEFRMGWETVDTILRHAVQRAIPEQNLAYVTGVYVDETQFGHGQDYITTFLDQRYKIVFMCVGHEADTIDLFVDRLIIQGGDTGNIRFFSANMSKAYESEVIKNFPNADLVWDRFHLSRSVNDTINDILKTLIKKGDQEALSLAKYNVLTHENMSEKQAERLRNIRMNNPEMVLAYDMKEAFQDIITRKNPNVMRNSLLAWIDWVELEGHELLRKKAQRFRDKIDRIMAWTSHPVSNSVSEGVNKNIQDICRQTCGFTDVHTFFCMLFLRRGNLTFKDLILISTIPSERFYLNPRRVEKLCLPFDKVFLDWSASYLDGKPTKSIRFGHTKDHRSDGPQICYGLAMDGKTHIPCGLTVVPGNMVDVAHFELSFRQIKPFLEKDCLIIFDNSGYSDKKGKLVKDADFNFLTRAQINKSNDTQIASATTEWELLKNDLCAHVYRGNRGYIKCIYFSVSKYTEKMESYRRKAERDYDEMEEMKAALDGKKKPRKKYRNSNVFVRTIIRRNFPLDFKSKEEATQFAIKKQISGREGYFILMSSRKMTASEMLSEQRSRNGIEGGGGSMISSTGSTSDH